MNTLIAYASKYGCTERCAKSLGEKLEGKVDLLDLRSGKPVDLSQYDKVVLGSSVYVGRVHKEVSEFCASNAQALQNKKLGLFICGMQKDDVIAEELKIAYPEELASKAAAKACFGGEFIFSKMSFMDKTITKVIAKTNKDTSNISESEIKRFAESMNIA